MDPKATDFFWQVALGMLKRDGVVRGTMMGYPCLRFEGAFFASAEPKTGDLVVKLPATRVQGLIASGTGSAFAPNGRRFKEWVRITERDARLWRKLIKEAKAFVEA